MRSPYSTHLATSATVVHRRPRQSLDWGWPGAARFTEHRSLRRPALPSPWVAGRPGDHHPLDGERYGLGGSTADRFTLHNIALLAMSAVCGIR